MSAPKLCESIPAVTAPVKLPKRVPGRGLGWHAAALATGLLALMAAAVGLVVL